MLKVKRVIKIGIVIFIIEVTLALTSPTMAASLKLKGYLGLYSPNFGKINYNLAQINAQHGTSLDLYANLISGLSIEYELFSNFFLRGEYFDFNITATDEYLDPEKGHVPVMVRISTSPIILNGIYEISIGKGVSGYIGTGIGIFPTGLQILNALGISGETELARTSIGYDFPVGVQFTPYKEKFILIVGEIKYISAKVHFSELKTSIDWTGWLFNLGVGVLF